MSFTRRRFFGFGFGAIAAFVVNELTATPTPDIYPEPHALNNIEFNTETSAGPTYKISNDNFVDSVPIPDEDYFDEKFRLPKSIADQVTFIGTQHRLPFYMALATHIVFALEAGLDNSDMSKLDEQVKLLESTRNFCQRVEQLVFHEEHSYAKAIEVSIKEFNIKTTPLDLLILTLDIRGANKGRTIVRAKEANGIVEVRSIKVAKEIEAIVEELFARGEAAGYNFFEGSSGYRDPELQIDTRIANGCGHKEDASKAQDVEWVFYRKASDCKIPTARPGRSMHERGLALDLKVNGGPVANNPEAFKWLKVNAPKIGLHNLRSEPWHWSINGS